MKHAFSKRILATILVLTLCMGLLPSCFSLSAATVTEFGPIDAMESGSYYLVVPSITPTGMSNGAYYVPAELATNPGFKFAAFDQNKLNDVPKWKITKISDTECTIQNEAKGANGYINMNGASIGYGAEQKLNYEFTGGLCKFFVVTGGNTYYIRFTNGGDTKEPRFHSGTGTASHQFQLWGTITYNAESSGNADLPLPDEDPLLTLACISDLHSDYGLQNKEPFVRNSVVKTLQAISQQENADILLVGGDNTSDNGGTSATGGWEYSDYQKVIAQYRSLASIATESGLSLWAAGNHEFQAGEDRSYNSYAGYEDIMFDACGEPLSVFRQKDDSSLASLPYPDFILGLHYNIKGFDFIVINAPWSKALQFSSGTYKWLEERLEEIGEEKTVFVVAHYPLTDSRGISTPTYGISGDQYKKITDIFEDYPNLIYLYGHNHGGAESVYIGKDTFERITSYTATGRVVNDRNTVPTSFITAFMGSMSYYNTSVDNGWLTEKDPNIVQSLFVYVYKDRIVFQMKNFGTYKGDKTNDVLKTWTVMRDVQGSLSGNNGNEGDESGMSALTKALLVTTDVNPAVKFDSSLNYGKFAFNESAPALNSYGSVLAGSGVNTAWKLSTKKLTSGAEYDALAAALQAVVKEFVVRQYVVKDGSNEVTVDGMVKVVTSALTDEFGRKTDTLDVAAYYLDENGNLRMADVTVSEDGKQYTFLMTKYGPFALSARAVVNDDAPEESKPTDTDAPSTDKPAVSGVVVGVVIACVVVVIAAAAIVIVVLGKRKNAPKA